MAENASYTMFLEIKGRLAVPLELGQVYLLGKEINGVKKSKNFIELKEEDLNQRHCVIEISHNQDAYVFDLLSLKGSFLNNKPLNSLEKRRLRNGDILKLGNQEIKYVCDGNEVSHDSSGFLDVNKNTSDIITSSPNNSSLFESRTKGVNHNFLVPSLQARKTATPNKSLSLHDTESNSSKMSLNTSSASFFTNNRRSDSFTIPETQYCKQRNTSNASDLSDNNPTEHGEKIKFNFGNLDSLDDDDDEFCIPETQEVLPAGKEKICLEEMSSRSKEGKESNPENSQFRICTQDYNEGFGEEASLQDISSQIIPLIKHPTIIFNNTIQCANEHSITQNMSQLNEPISKVDQETLIIRRDCPTPDIFDFEGQEAVNAGQQNLKSNNKTSTDLDANLMDEDEEDFLPTQAIPSQLIAKAADSKNLNQLDKPCLEEENEEVLTLSDKENRCPMSLAAITDLPPTQLLESKSNASNTIKLNSSAINSNTTTSAQNNGSKSLLNIELDEEDNLLTQAFLQPPDIPISTTRSDAKVITQNPIIYIDEILEEPPLKETSAATGFKKPAKDFSVLKKNSSSTSETDLDLLMCTPQLIKDNIFVGRTEDLKQNILAAKNNHLFDDETDEEDDDDDDQGNLVKLINVPKDSLDFDKLLPHLNRKPNSNKISEEQRAAAEAQKIYKFNISFNRELDEKQSKLSVSKSSTFDRDERHAARDKEKEVTEHQKRTKTNKKKVQNQNKGKGKNISSLKDKETEDRKKDTETKETDNTDKASNEKKIKEAKSVITKSKAEEESTTQQKKVTRQRKRHTPADITEKEKQSTTDDEMQKMSARRITRLMSKGDETVNKEVEGKRTKTTQIKKDNLNNNSVTQPILRVTRSRSISKTNESQDSVTSNNSSHKNTSYHKESDKDDASLQISANVNTTSKKVVGRKRKGNADGPPVVAPTERKRLKNSSQESQSSSPAAAISISMTMVDQELFKNLVNDSKGLWDISKNIADCDILVMDKAFRTFKFLFAMAKGIPIVTSEYLRKLNETKSVKKVKINDYLFADEEFEKKHKFSLVKSLQAAKKNKIFKGYEFVMTSNILPNPQEIEVLIEASGGIVHHKNPPQPQENQKLYLVTSKEDKKFWHKYRRLNKNIIIVSTEAVMSAVMSQNCERLAKYTLA